MKILLTGGSGFIGGYVVKALHKQGHDVRCLLRSTSDTTRISDFPFEKTIGDVLQAESVDDAMESCDVCIHLALSAAWDQMRTEAQIQKLLETSETGTKNILEAAKRRGARVVYASSIAAINCSVTSDRIFSEDSEPEPLAATLAYSRLKREGEALVQKYASEGLAVVIVNPAEVYGPLDTALVTAGNLKQIILDWPTTIPSTGGTSIVHVEDVAHAIAAACTKGTPGQRYILGGPNLSIRELARITLRLAGPKQANKWVLPIPSKLLQMVVNALAALRLPTPIEPGVLDFAVLYWYMDSSKAERDLGFQIRSTEEILKPTIDWLRESKHIP
ncbi:hypothetical protein CYMTET_14178 [Cymbomonas tetramitiformis]|uniref:NAD-dependent epimerase/dehydratase domain-containing protein n=1 Tax=Cymbomonas tetramitiformis TaxID=36881 RepID=A0AAE0GGZ9_9CHLO|nr:hypothetical protein CYMTET_14178 [Cymbomonas tetramitiformis]